MAASSSSSKYHVFLNFRGEDTRRTFISHLYAALCQRSIRVFLDDEGIERGNDLSPTLQAAIEGSEISIVIFSENYANSKWCLHELDKIMKCRSTLGQIVLPIFYNVDPSNVRHQIGKYKTAFVEHEKRYRPSKVKKWRATLREAATIVGWDSTRTRSDAELVENIVEYVFERLNHIIDPHPKEFVGIPKRITNVESLLCIGSNKVNIVGIWGMVGVGKTSIASALFSKHYSQFQGCCFLENVREEWKNRKDYLQNKLLSHILRGKKGQLRHKKILIVLDDVSEPQQVKDLVGMKNRYGKGSKIIVTTRDKSVLQNEYDGLYKVELLDSGEAHQLFCMNAFKPGQPKSKFLHLIDMAVDYAGGNPLALKVLGSYLYSKNMREWESALQKLKKFPNARIQNLLRVSYDELDDEEQSILLDVSATLKGEKKWHVKRLLEGCGFSVDIAMRNLQDKSFIDVKNDQTIWMHDLIQEMGRGIVREESTRRPELRSRLWDPKDINSVFSRETVTDHCVGLESISLDVSQIEDISIEPRAFARMQSLRLLNFYASNRQSCRVHTPKGLESLPNQICYLHWDCFPLKALPASFNPKNLVELNLSHSHIVKLWDAVQDLANLKSLYLSGCKHLLELPDLSKANKLEELHLGFCTSLVEVASYILSLDHLLAIDLEGCTELQSIKSNNHSKSLLWVNLSGCSKLVEFLVTSEKLEYLSLIDTAIQEVPSSIWQNKNLSCLYLSRCLKLKKLPPIVGSSLSITSLFLDGCSNLSELPDNLNLLATLDTLSLQGSHIETLPGSTNHLSRLRSLDVSHCKRLRSLPELPLSLQHLNVKACTSLETLSSSNATTLIQNSFHRQNWKLLLKQHQKLKIPLPHKFEFNNCIRLDVNAQNIIMDEAITRIKYAAHLSSMGQAYGDPYHQFQIFSKDYDGKTLESICHQLCVGSLRGNIPEWFQIQDIKSSSIVIKLNANCCSHCRSSDFAFGLFHADKEEDPHLNFSGMLRICVNQMFEIPVRWFEKCWNNDVRVCLPGSRIPSCFLGGDQTCVLIELPQSSNLLGFAFCVISSHLPSTDKECLPMIRCKCSLVDAKCIGPFWSIYCYSCDWELILDSAFLWYDVETSNRILHAIKESSDANQLTTHNPRLSFQFYCKSGIKECGVWPIYALDLESKMVITDEIQARFNKNSHKRRNPGHPMILRSKMSRHTWN